MTETEFICEFWENCKGCEIDDTAHTVETEVMRDLYRRVVASIKAETTKAESDSPKEERNQLWLRLTTCDDVIRRLLDPNCSIAVELAHEALKNNADVFRRIHR